MTARMGKLERRTNEALTSVFRQRLQAMRGKTGTEAGDVDLVAGISAAEHERDGGRDSDDE